MSEQVIWNLSASTIFLLSLFQLRKGLIDSTTWFCLLFSIGFSGNVIGYPLALSNDPVFIFMKDMPTTTLYGQITFVAMVAAWMGHYLVKRKLALTAAFKTLPELPLSDSELDKIFRFLISFCAFLAIILVMSGYLGYFISSDYLITPPRWLEIVKALITISIGLLFLVVVKEFQKNKKLGTQTLSLLAIWIIEGFLSGFKYMVVTPGLFVLIGAWIAGRVRGWHYLLLALLIVAAYSVVEPMREAKCRMIRSRLMMPSFK